MWYSSPTTIYPNQSVKETSGLPYLLQHRSQQPWNGNKLHVHLLMTEYRKLCTYAHLFHTSLMFLLTFLLNNFSYWFLGTFLFEKQRDRHFVFVSLPKYLLLTGSHQKWEPSPQSRSPTWGPDTCLLPTKCVATRVWNWKQSWSQNMHSHMGCDHSTRLFNHCVKYPPKELCLI